MTPIFELSAAPHRPYSMLDGRQSSSNKDFLEFSKVVRLVMRNGELHVEIEPTVDRHCDQF